MLTDEFKSINIFPNYSISNSGEVKNIITNKILKPRKHQRGYLTVCLYKDKKPYNTFIHRLIAIHFIENPNNYKIVDHIDKDTSNNNIDNLRWVTLQTNNYNSNKQNKKCSSIYKGVYYSNKNNIYTSSIVIGGTKHHLGSFKTEEEAFNKRNEYIQQNNILI